MTPQDPVRRFQPAVRKRHVPADTASLIAMVGDLVMVLTGLMVGFWLRFRSGLLPLGETWWTSGDTSLIAFRDYLALILVGALILFATFLYHHLYRPQYLLRFRQVANIVVRSAAIWLVAYLGLSLSLKFQPAISRLYVLMSFVTTLAAVLSWRFIFHSIVRSGAWATALRQHIVFVGWNSEAAKLAEAMRADAAQPYTILGWVPSPNGTYPGVPGGGLKTLGGYDQLPKLLQECHVDVVILADLGAKSEEVVGLTNLCERMLIGFKIIPSYFQILVSGLALETISGVPILGVAELPLDRIHNRMIKRTADIVGALVGLTLSIPIIVVCGFLIRRESPGPIFYRQVRTGRKGLPFQIVKLRSMRQDAEKAGAQWAKKGDDRRLKIGAFLREWNLDELPQFWNVLKGDMSLVGPRPERPELIANFQFEIPHYNARLVSKPGITGWAQVNGLRGDTDLSERVRHDLFYLENWSVWLDFQIMAMTFLNRKNAY